MNQTTFKPEGDLTFQTIATIQEQIKASLKSAQEGSFVFDLSAIDKCDSAGLALLIDSVSNLRKQSIRYQLVGLSQDIQSLATFYEVESLLMSER